MPPVTAVTSLFVMTTAMTAESPYSGSRMAQTLAAFRSASGLDVAFGGAVRADGSALDITATCGAKGGSLQGLRIMTGQGLGGKALQTLQPGAVDHYYTARGITHHYDAAVRQEQIETVAALPIVVDRVPRMVVYLASRAQLGLGAVWFDGLRPLIRSLERQIMVDDEVRLRLSRLLPDLRIPSQPKAIVPVAGLADRHELVAELVDHAGVVTDPAVRRRLEGLVQRVTGSPVVGLAPAPATPTIHLAARELDVLGQVALGRSNREAAEALGIVESTAKSYLKSATRKLGANNRVHAVCLAREAGLID